MIEMLGVLAIIGVLSAGGIMGYSAAMESYKTNKTIDDISKFVVAASDLIRNINPKSSTMSIIIDTQLCALGILAEPYCSHKSRWDTSSYFQVEENNNCISWGVIKGNEPCAYINIVIVDIPKNACVKLLTNDWSNFSPAYRVAIYEYQAPSGTPYKFNAAAGQNQPPLSVAEAETACTITTYDSSKVEARFYLKGTPL